MSEPKDEVLLTNWICGYQISQAIFVAVRLGVPDILEAGPMHYEQLSETIKSHSESLYRLLRTLATIGIFQETQKGIFSNTPRSQLLVSCFQNSLYLTAMRHGSEQYRVWSELMNSITTGQDAFSKIYQQDYFSYLETHPESFKIFNDFVGSNTRKRIDSILSAYDFSKIEKVVDVGGGAGDFLVSLLDKYPKTKGIVFDSEKTISAAIKLENFHHVKDRIEFVMGDFLENVPPDADMYFLSNIIHGWSDDQALRILNNCRKVIKQKGKLIIVERILSSGNDMDYGKWMDINMLVMCKGKERTLEEYTQLLSAANFELKSVTPTSVGVSIIEALVIA